MRTPVPWLHLGPRPYHANVRERSRLNVPSTTRKPDIHRISIGSVRAFAGLNRRDDGLPPRPAS
jgi:hypothetical protein